MHLVIGDRAGDSAIIEIINGKPEIYHGRAYRVMTNSPTYDKQLPELKRYQGFGGQKPPPEAKARRTGSCAPRIMSIACPLPRMDERPSRASSACGTFLSHSRWRAPNTLK